MHTKNFWWYLVKNLVSIISPKLPEEWYFSSVGYLIALGKLPELDKCLFKIWLLRICLIFPYSYSEFLFLAYSIHLAWTCWGFNVKHKLFINTLCSSRNQTLSSMFFTVLSSWNLSSVFSLQSHTHAVHGSAQNLKRVNIHIWKLTALTPSYMQFPPLIYNHSVSLNLLCHFMLIRSTLLIGW